MITFDIPNDKSIFTRQCFGETIVELLKKTELNSLKINDIVQKAGFSRVTFYRYYSCVKDVLQDYLQIIVSKFITASNQENHGSFLTYEHILFALNFFDEYRHYFLVMKKRGLYGMLIDAVNQFMEQYMHLDKNIDFYKTYSYAGGLLNAFLMWEENDKKEKAEDVAKTMYELYGQS